MAATTAAFTLNGLLNNGFRAEQLHVRSLTAQPRSQPASRRTGPLIANDTSAPTYLVARQGISLYPGRFGVPASLLMRIAQDLTESLPYVGSMGNLIAPVVVGVDVRPLHSSGLHGSH